MIAGTKFTRVGVAFTATLKSVSLEKEISRYVFEVESMGVSLGECPVVVSRGAEPNDDSFAAAIQTLLEAEVGKALRKMVGQ